MFNNLKLNASFYIFDKNDNKLYIGKIANKSNIDYSNPLAHVVDITVNTEVGQFNFKKVPANVDVAVDDGTNTIIGDNRESVSKEIENVKSYHQRIVDSYDFSKSAIENCDQALIILDPKIAKEKENENKLNALDNRINNIENGLNDIKGLLAKALNSKE